MKKVILLALMVLFSPFVARAQDSGALKLLYAASVSTASCSSGTVTLTVTGGVPTNLVTGVYVDVGGSTVTAWNGNGLGPVTVSGSTISYTKTCSGFSAYTGGAYVSAQIPFVGSYYVVDVPTKMRLALGNNSINCASNSCVYGMGLSDLFDNKNDNEFDITSWSATGSSVTLTLSGNPTWSANQPISVFGSSLSSGTFTSTGSINGGFLIGSISTNTVTYTLNSGITCTGTCTGAGGFVYQIDMGSPDAGLAQMQFGVNNGSLNIASTSLTGTGASGDGKTVTVTLSNAAITGTAANGNNITVAGVTTTGGSCSFNGSYTLTATPTAGTFQYQIGSVQASNCTGTGGTIVTQRWGEIKNSGGAQFTVVESNNVRVRIKETSPMAQYGQLASCTAMPGFGGGSLTNCQDQFTTLTEYYTIYRPDKVFHRFDMTYTGGDNQAPLLVGNLYSESADATTQIQVLKPSNFANNKGEADTTPCGQYPLVTMPWQHLWQGYIDSNPNKTWMLMTPNHASWYGTVNIAANGTSVTLATGDNFAAGMPLASWNSAVITLWTTSGTAVQATVSSVTNGSDYTGGTTLSLTASNFPSTNGVNYYVGNIPPFDFGNSSNCGISISAVGVLQPNPGNVQTCSTAPNFGGGTSGCPSPYTYGTLMSGIVKSQYLRILGTDPLLSTTNPALGTYQGQIIQQWFEGMRARLTQPIAGSTIAGDSAAHTVLLDTLRLGDDGIWQGSATQPRTATQAVAGAYAAEYEIPPMPTFTTGSCTSGFSATNCYDQDTGAYQITASNSSVNLTLSLPSWQANFTYGLGSAVWDGTNVEVATFAGASSGASGSSVPTWASTCPNLGNTCTDNNVTWYNAGNRFFHYPAFEFAGINTVPSTITVNTKTYVLNTDYVATLNSGGMILQLLTGDTGTAGFYASGLNLSFSPVATCALSPCGTPPNYCARTDTNVQSETALTGSMFQTGNFTNGVGTGQGYINFSAGSIYNDPDFNSAILRVTDGNTLPGAGCFNVAGYNSTMTNGGNSDEEAFSSDEAYVRAYDTNGNEWLFSFNTGNMSTACVKVPGTPSGQLPFGNNGGWGRAAADNRLWFGVTGTNFKVYHVDTQATNTLFTYSGCTGASWMSSMPSASFAWRTTPALSANDDLISAAIGGQQNEGWLVWTYQQSTGHCGWLDTRTGAVGGNLWSTTQTSGAFPTGFGTNGGPSAPTATQTTGGSLTTGHTIAVQYSLVYESPEGGAGESAGSSVQTVALTGGNTALSLPSPGTSSTDHVPVTHYNVYACDRTSSPGCTPTLQPAANLGCTMASPAAPGVTVNTSGSTTWTYTEIAEGPNCNTWSSTTITTGAATPNNTITSNSVTGATYYKIEVGAAGSATTWTSGTSTVDQTAFPAQINDAGSPPTTTDNGGYYILAGTGTIPQGTASTLTSLTTTGPQAPTVSTMGIGLHQMVTTFNSSPTAIGYLLSTPISTGAVGWWVGNSATTTFCTSGQSYDDCSGHISMGHDGFVNVSGPADPLAIYSNEYRLVNNIQLSSVSTLCSSPVTHPCATINPYPSTGSTGSCCDSHPSWNSNTGTDLASIYLDSSDPGPGAAGNPVLNTSRAWNREIFGVNPATGTVYRFAHHRSADTPYIQTNCGSPNACENSNFGATSIAQISPDGKWALFNSNMEWLLGCQPGASCTYNVNNQVASGTARTDVFIVHLK